jgi:hypothetical protein
MPISKQIPPDLAAFLEIPDEPEPPAPVSAPVLEVLEELKPQEAAFVANLAAGMSNAKALLEAGWTGNPTGASRAAALWKARPAVKAALAAMVADFAEKSGYTRDVLMEDLAKARDFAENTKNATAYVRAVELMGKANGHLIEKTENKNLNAGFQIQINGIDDK